MRFHAAPFRLTFAALAASALLGACGGGGDASPPIDSISPSLAIADNVPAIVATGTVTFDFTFSEPVTGFDASDIVVSGGTAGTFTIGATNRTATLTVTPSANATGTLQVSVAAGRFTDLAGNASAAAANTSQTFDTRVVSPPPPPPVTNLVANGGFSNGAAGWVGNAVDVRTEGGNSFNFANVTAAGEPFAVNISYPLSIPTQGVRYRLTFTASSDRARTMLAGIGLNEGPFTNASESVNLTSTPQTFVRELTANFASTNSRVLFDMGAAVGTVVIDNVVLEVVTTTPPPATPGGALTFSSGFASNVLTTEGGRVDSAGGSNLDGFNCNGLPAFCGSGAGGSGAESFMFFYYQTPSPATALYSQVEVFAPGVTGFIANVNTAGVTVTNQTRVNFTFNPNPEWYNSTNNRFGVVLTLGRSYPIGPDGCRLQLHGVRAPTAPGSTAYSMNLRTDFRVASNCGTGIAPTDVAAALAASPVISSVKFLGAAGGAAILGRDNVASGANLSIANGDSVYPTTVALRGGITFD